MSKNLANTVRAMLDDVEAVANAYYQHSPDPSGWEHLEPVPERFAAARPFACLHAADQADFFRTSGRLEDYEAAGISYRQISQIISNVIEGKPRSEWLDGTGLPDPDRRKSLADLKQRAEAKQPVPSKNRDRSMDR